MAKTAVINRDQKRRLTVKRYAKRRAELLAIIGNAKFSDEQRLRARRRLEQLPRDSSATRLRRQSAHSAASPNRRCAARRRRRATPRCAIAPNR